MSDIRELGKQPDGKPIRGYEVEFETDKEPWAEYHLEDGTRVRIKHTLLKAYRLVDDDENPIVDPNGDPIVFINGGIAVVSTQAKKG